MREFTLVSRRHNQGPPILNEYGECDTPVYVTPEGRAVYATHRDASVQNLIPHIRQPERVAPLKAAAINPENIPDPNPSEYTSEGRFLGDPKVRIKQAVRELIYINLLEREARIDRRNGDDTMKGSTAKNQRRDKFGVAIMS